MRYSSNRFAMVAMLAAVGANAFYAQANQEDVAAAAGTPATAPTAADTAAAEAQKEAQVAQIKAKFNNKVDVKETNFFFRKVKNEVKNPETGEVSIVETKRPTVTIPVPVPSVEGIIAILESDNQKQLDLLLEAVANVVIDQAREKVNEKEDINAENFPYETLAWDFIANLPKAERRGGGISKELWDDFEADYIAIMPALTGKKEDAVKNAARIFKAKFQGAQTNKPVLKVLEGQLGIYAANTAQGEQLTPCIEFLTNKLEKLLNTDESALLAAL
jgi:hypothetical protein